MVHVDPQEVINSLKLMIGEAAVQSAMLGARITQLEDQVAQLEAQLAQSEAKVAELLASPDGRGE